jgi:ElaB/YqjD/DUF883 family membrane-anchored ribosome-binding protein
MEKTDVGNRLQEWQRRASERAKSLGQTTDKYVRENTWSTLALAMILGCVVGYLLRGDRERSD